MAGSPDSPDLSETSSDESLQSRGRVEDILPELSAADWRLEVLCGVTVALALVPEAVAFALAGGLEPAIGLNSAWIIAIFTGILGGRPAMICGATGSLAVLVGGTVHGDGKEYLFFAVILMGIFEIVLGLLRVGSLVKLIPSPVMIGFCNGLALVIGFAQFSNFKDPRAAHRLAARRLSAFDAFTDGVPFIGGVELVFAIVITAVAFVVCLFLPKLTTKVPSALVAIVTGTIAEWLFVRAICRSETPTVGDVAALRFGGDFPIPLWFDGRYHPPPLNLDTLESVSSLAITMAAVGLLESLMTLNLIDEITHNKSSTARECIGQGIANIVCGALGGMGGCAMIGQSMINISSGARARTSSVCAGVFLMLIVLVAGPVINSIPVSALVGVMFNVVYHTFEFRSLKLMALASMPLRMRRKFFSESTSRQKIRRADALIILTVTVVTLMTNLATAVFCGMLLSLFIFALETADLINVVGREEVQSTGEVLKYYEVHGVLFFGSTSKFLECFDASKDPKEVHLLFENGYIADFSAIEALNKLAERYGDLGKRIVLQQTEMKPRTFQIVSQASGLLNKQLTLGIASEELLDAHREHPHVESFPGIDAAGILCAGREEDSSVSE